MRKSIITKRSTQKQEAVKTKKPSRPKRVVVLVISTEQSVKPSEHQSLINELRKRGFDALGLRISQLGQVSDVAVQYLYGE